MAYQLILTRREKEALEVYTRFRLEGFTRDRAMRYIGMMGYEVSSNLATDIIINEKQIWGTK